MSCRDSLIYIFTATISLSSPPVFMMWNPTWSGQCDFTLTGFVLHESSDAASASINILQLLCLCSIDAGHIFVTCPSSVFFTASALRFSGTGTIKHALFIICRMLIDIACRGTCSKASNHPSPNCCFLHISSSSTVMNGSSVSKSAGGSVNSTPHLRVRKVLFGSRQKFFLVLYAPNLL